jgi:hypothetical protein
MKITRKQLRNLIREALETYDDTGKLTSRVDKPNQTFRRLPHELQQEPVSPETAMGTIDQSGVKPETYFKVFSKATPLRKTTTQSGRLVLLLIMKVQSTLCLYHQKNRERLLMTIQILKDHTIEHTLKLDRVAAIQV